MLLSKAEYKNILKNTVCNTFNINIIKKYIKYLSHFFYIIYLNYDNTKFLDFVCAYDFRKFIEFIEPESKSYLKHNL